jgi:hypothetical protein
MNILYWISEGITNMSFQALCLGNNFGTARYNVPFVERLIY